jgi:hypothetical protein
MTWQPIETAPKDGTRILIWDDDEGGYEIGFWSSNHESWLDNDICDGDPGKYWPGDLLGNTIFEPTHWMPLPEPPAAKKSA